MGLKITGPGLKKGAERSELTPVLLPPPTLESDLVRWGTGRRFVTSRSSSIEVLRREISERATTLSSEDFLQRGVGPVGWGRGRLGAAIGAPLVLYLTI